MKKVVFMTLVVFLSMGFTLEAQENTRNRRDNRQGFRTESRWTAKERADAMTKQLELSAEEATKVQELLEKHDAERAERMATQRADRERLSADREARREEMRVAREKAVAENDAALEKIIGKEKLDQWKQFREERQNTIRDANRKGRRNAPPRR